MKKKIKVKSKNKKVDRVDSDFPVGKISVVSDFLPSPEEFAIAEKKVKILIELDESTVVFFKEKAKKNKSKYQRLIRDVLRHYTNKFGH